MTWGSANKWGRKKTSDRGPVTWTNNDGQRPAPFAQKLPKYVGDDHISEHHLRHLFIGAMWLTSVPLALTPGSSVLERTFRAKSAQVTKSSIMIYAGTLRIEEREGNGRLVTVPRHTFIVNGTRLIVQDFSLISPVCDDQESAATPSD